MTAQRTMSVDIIDTTLRDGVSDPVDSSSQRTSDLQGLERGDAELRREQTGEERQHCGAGLTCARDIARTACHQPSRQNGCRMIHEDREHGSQEKAHNRDSNGVLNQ